MEKKTIKANTLLVAVALLADGVPAIAFPSWGVQVQFTEEAAEGVAFFAAITGAAQGIAFMDAAMDYLTGERDDEGATVSPLDFTKFGSVQSQGSLDGALANDIEALTNDATIDEALAAIVTDERAKGDDRDPSAMKAALRAAVAYRAAKATA